MSKPFYFHYQVEGKESKWDLALSSDRQAIIQEKRPAFTTVLDLSSIPDDNDWTKVRYSGPFYADFDADGDLDLVCDQFGVFLGKLDSELDFDVSQARFFASGSKGFHIEIPAECFQVKVPEQGTTWLPYMYRAMAESLMVDTLDLNVYTGKRGRQWRTTNVQRENGCYKVPLTLEEALSITPDLYRELIKTPREIPTTTPPSCNTKFSLRFQNCKDKTIAHMKGKKKRQEKANAVLDPWRQGKLTPPTIEALMKGENIAEGVGFQRIAMQLAIYATSVGMDEEEFISRCSGLVESHNGDGYRYQGADRKRNELRRMYEYMAQDSLYDFEVGPIIKLLVKGTSAPDLGILDVEDPTDPTPKKEVRDDDGNVIALTTAGNDVYKSVRKGFLMNGDGMFVQVGDIYNCLCRGMFRDVEAYYDLEDQKFLGYEFKIRVRGRKDKAAMLGSESFTSAMAMKKFLATHQLTYQGNDAETAALMDSLSEKSDRGKRKTYVYPREGLFVIDHPHRVDPKPVIVYLTQDNCILSQDVDPTDEDYFELKYKPNQASSAYNLDIHKAPELCEDHIDALHDLFSFTKPDVLADMLGWFVACHLRTFYHYHWKQFPLLQVYGEAGSGKSQTVRLLAHLHWYRDDQVSIKSAASCTPFAMDMHASSSTSAPFIMDEYKPRELRKQGSKHEKLKDVFKAAYLMGDIGERGTINKGAENALSIVKSKATAPIVFMGEAIEMESAIIERSVTVRMSKGYLTRRRKDAFNRLQADPTAISALGRALVEAAFTVDLETMRLEVNHIRKQVEASLPDFGDSGKKRASERPIFNRVVIIHALSLLRRVLASKFGGQEFNEVLDQMQGARTDMSNAEDERLLQLHAMSEVSKTISRIALLSRAAGKPYEMQYGKDYIFLDGSVEFKVERGYDCYRQYCSSINDQPLFDSLDAFIQALMGYQPVTDRICHTSELRDGSTETIMRMDLQMLNIEGIQQFRNS